MKKPFIILIAWALPFLTLLLICALPFAMVLGIFYLFLQPKQIEKPAKKPVSFFDFAIKHAKNNENVK